MVTTTISTVMAIVKIILALSWINLLACGLKCMVYMYESKVGQ